MGTIINLKVGALEIDYGKNSLFNNHCAIFQESNLTKHVEDEQGEDPYVTEAYLRPLGEIVPRLELLGYNLATARKEYLENTDEYGEKIRRPLSFAKLLTLIKSINLSVFTGEWTENCENKYVPPEVIAKISSSQHMEYNSRPDYWSLDMLIEDLSPYTKLRLLAENPNNLSQPVSWVFGHLVENGWAKREEFMMRLAPEQQFLIVTEGSSDAKVIAKALALLRPGYADFFRFVDMEEGYPFTGTGNLFKFTQGLVSIGVLNRTVILYDNDTEGVSKYLSTKKLTLPKNMVVEKLPDIAALRKFPTIGPHRERKEDINGKAAAIECYLDLSFKRDSKPVRVRWSVYLESMKQYQGALEEKETFCKPFFKLKHRDPEYDFSKIEAVLDHLYKSCVTMAAL